MVVEKRGAARMIMTCPGRLTGWRRERGWWAWVDEGSRGLHGHHVAAMSASSQSGRLTGSREIVVISRFRNFGSFVQSLP